jgi:hypothetical protein
MNFDLAKSAALEIEKALESIAYSSPESLPRHQHRLALALAAVAAATDLDHGRGRRIPALIDAANVLLQEGHGEVSRLVMLAARSIAEGS